nr:hypothetical protein BSM_16470 [uncultured archaeon]
MSEFDDRTAVEHLIYRSKKGIKRDIFLGFFPFYFCIFSPSTLEFILYHRILSKYPKHIYILDIDENIGGEKEKNER